VAATAAAWQQVAKGWLGKVVAEEHLVHASKQIIAAAVVGTPQQLATDDACAEMHLIIPCIVCGCTPEQLSSLSTALLLQHALICIM
jgi:hypothetical protein